jgi:hypothetical protein
VVDNSIKGMELPTSCITFSKNEKEFCRFLKNVKVPSDYSMNVLRLISLPDLKVAPGVKSHNYHILLTQMIVIGIQNILLVNIQEAIMIRRCLSYHSIRVTIDYFYQYLPHMTRSSTLTLPGQ